VSVSVSVYKVSIFTTTDNNCIVFFQLHLVHVPIHVITTVMLICGDHGSKHYLTPIHRESQ